MSLKLPRNWDFSTFRAESGKMVRSKSVMPGEGSPGSSRANKPPMEKPLKKGWLKKQRSIVKNWHLRFFVLRGNILTYHKDDRESATQGTIPLLYSQVNELPSNTDDKFLFEIVPRGCGEREREAYVLMATSQAEMEEWVRLMRRAIGVPSSRVFGQSLPDIMASEKRFGRRLVPILVEKCADFIRQHGLHEEGIFRLPGQDNQVKQFREAFDAGERPSFPSDTDVHTVGSLLKLYLRELPESVVPWAQYQAFLDSSLPLDTNTASGREQLEEQIQQLPKVNHNLLSYICRFLFEVQQYSKVNKMSVENLATVMGVNLFKPQVEDAISMMKGTPQIQKVMTVMIRHHELLFPPASDVAPSPPPSKKTKSKKAKNPRSFVGWESAECEASSLSESPEEEDSDLPETETGDVLGTEVRSEVGSSLQPSSVGWSPRKRTQTLPSLGCPLAGRSGREDPRNRWSKLTECLEEREEKTLSEDIFKILDLQSASLFSRKEESGTGKGQESRNSDIGLKQVDSPKRGVEPEPPSDTLAASKQGLDSPKSIVPEAHTQQTSGWQGHSEGQGVHGQGPGHTTEDPQQLIDSLKQHIMELNSTVAQLQATLEAEKRSRSALETRLHNAEHSHQQVQLRNQELEHQVQQLLRGDSNSTT